MLANAARTCAETEEVGLETIAELQSNREKIESARTKVCIVKRHSTLFFETLFILSSINRFRAKSSKL
jgi:hypothetical protein